MELNEGDAKRLHMAATKAFTPATPINGLSLFSGRNAQVGQVIDAINQTGQHAIIYGERGVGKTSLANVLKDFLEDPNISFPIFAPKVTCDSGDNFSSVWVKAFRTIREFGAKRKVDLPNCPIFEILDEYKENLLDVIEEIKLDPDVIRRSLDEVSEPIILIVIIDEFDRIKSSSNQSLFADSIKMLSDHAINATTILVGVADSVDDLIKEHQSVERALVQVQMPRMSKDEIFEIIHKGLERLENMEIEDMALDVIASFAKGLPYYAHLIGLHSARHALSRKELIVRGDDVFNGLKEALKRVEHSIESSYHTAIASKRKDSLASKVLLACAMANTDQFGYFRPADVKGPYAEIRNDGKKYSTGHFSQHLANFCDASRGSIMERYGFKYRFVNPLLQPYVIMDGYSRGIIKSIT